MNIIIIAALALGVFDTGYSRTAEVYAPSASSFEMFERQTSGSHGIGCTCFGCTATREAFDRAEADGAEAERRARRMSDYIERLGDEEETW